MKRAEKNVYMSRILVLAFVMAILGIGGERVCFGLANESPWPLPTVWWAGAKVGEPNYWMDPCNWSTGAVPDINQRGVGHQFTTPPNGVGEPPVYTGEPNIVIIRAGEVAECNYMMWGGQQSYANLVIQGTLNMGSGPGTVFGLRICSWTNWNRNKVIVDGGKLNVNGDTDQSYMIVPSGDVNIIGQIGMGVASAWSDQYYLTIRDGNVRAGDIVMANAGVVGGPLIDINGTGQLVVTGNLIDRLSGYKSNGWITAYGGDPNHVVTITLDANGNTVVKAGLFNASKAKIVDPNNGFTVPWEDPNNPGYGPTLRWLAGTGATAHRVYFGTSFTTVNEANESSPQYKGQKSLATLYHTIPLTEVNLGRSYYWRIDEVVGGSPVKGDVWQFSIPNYRVVDEFHTYPSDTELWNVWMDGAVNGTGGFVYLETTTVHEGTSANLNYNNASPPYISEANMICSAKPGCPNDWTAAGVKLLTLSLHGNTSFAEKVYVMLESNGGAQKGVVYYSEPNELRQGSWEWYRFLAIDLAQFSAQGVDLKNVSRMTIGVGNKASPTAGGSGSLYVDTIRLQPPIWLDRSGDADIDNDGVVNMNDLDALANAWLMSSTVVTASAPTTGPVLWYKFDEGTDYFANDSSGNSYTGNLNLPNWGGAGSGFDSSNCINLNNDTFVEAPIGAFDSNWAKESTVSLWIKDPGQTDDDSTLFQANTPSADMQVWVGSTGAFSWQCGYDSNTSWNNDLLFGQYYLYSNPAHPLNRWVHYAFVKSASGRYMRIYQDGKIVAENTNVPGDSLAAPDYFSIGAWRYSVESGGFYDGLMDDFRIYNYALSPSEVLSLAIAGGTVTSPMTQPLLTPANIVPDNIVNFKDYAVMADKWRQAALFP
jgi:hypothetical protein